MMTADGERVGTHDGIARYTVGQRRGLGVAVGQPIYVTEIRRETNTVVVGSEDETFSDRLTATRATWHEPPEALAGRRLHCQIRSRHAAAPCRLNPTGEAAFDLVFEEPQRSIAPGQVACVYDEANETVVAGGWIAG
jgi:tRNA-specific 2-thiouridylase